MNGMTETLYFAAEPPEAEDQPSLETQLAMAAEELAVEPTVEELAAIIGMLRCIPASTPLEAELRFDIVASKHRSEANVIYNSHHLALLGLLKHVRRDED